MSNSTETSWDRLFNERMMFSGLTSQWMIVGVLRSWSLKPYGIIPATLVVGLTPRCSQSVLIQILLQILKICKKAQSQSLLRMDLTSGQALSLRGKIRGFSHPFTVLLSRSSHGKREPIFVARKVFDLPRKSFRICKVCD
jgi:hypothetical protein